MGKVKTTGQQYREFSVQLGEIRQRLGYRGEESEEENSLMDKMDEIWEQLSPEDIEALHKEGHFVRGYDDDDRAESSSSRDQAVASSVRQVQEGDHQVDRTQDEREGLLPLLDLSNPLGRQ